MTILDILLLSAVPLVIAFGLLVYWGVKMFFRQAGYEEREDK